MIISGQWNDIDIAAPGRGTQSPARSESPGAEDQPVRLTY